MSEISPEIQEASIVLRGNFNPAIFQPAWFAKQHLLRDQEAESAKVEVITSQLAVLAFAEWLRIQVTDDRFVAATTLESEYEPFRDLVLGTFQILCHTPVNKLGINRGFHFRMETAELWHKVGDRLTPKDVWKDLLGSPGLNRLVIQGKRPDGRNGAINVTVAPSNRVRPGVYVGVNDHFELDSEEGAVTGADVGIEVLSREWSGSMKRSMDLSTELVRRCLDA